jgi:hypothetical protein
VCVIAIKLHETEAYPIFLLPEPSGERLGEASNAGYCALSLPKAEGTERGSMAMHLNSFDVRSMPPAHAMKRSGAQADRAMTR